VNAGLTVAVSLGVEIPSFAFMIVGIGNLVLVGVVFISFWYFESSRGKVLKKKLLAGETKEDEEVTFLLCLRGTFFSFEGDKRNPVKLNHSF
jgi:hypothetical protein